MKTNFSNQKTLETLIIRAVEKRITSFYIQDKIKDRIKVLKRTNVTSSEITFHLIEFLLDVIQNEYMDHEHRKIDNTNNIL